MNKENKPWNVMKCVSGGLLIKKSQLNIEKKNVYIHK